MIRLTKQYTIILFLIKAIGPKIENALISLTKVLSVYSFSIQETLGLNSKFITGCLTKKVINHSDLSIWSILFPSYILAQEDGI